MKGCGDIVPLLGPLRDGALAGDDRGWVEDHLRGCASCRDRLAFLSAQGQALREALVARAARVDLSGFADRVLARAGQDRASAAERTPVWAREMWWFHGRAIGAVTGVALAACAALAVVFSPAQTEEVLLADNSPQIEAVDFGTREGAILQLPGQTTVIWMSDDREAQQ